MKYPAMHDVFKKCPKEHTLGIVSEPAEQKIENGKMHNRKNRRSPAGIVPK
jgi:hypothetical protein